MYRLRLVQRLFFTHIQFNWLLNKRGLLTSTRVRKGGDQRFAKDSQPNTTEIDS